MISLPEVFTIFARPISDENTGSLNAYADKAVFGHLANRIQVAVKCQRNHGFRHNHRRGRCLGRRYCAFVWGHIAIQRNHQLGTAQVVLNVQTGVCLAFVRDLRSVTALLNRTVNPRAVLVVAIITGLGGLTGLSFLSITVLCQTRRQVSIARIAVEKGSIEGRQGQHISNRAKPRRRTGRGTPSTAHEPN